MPPTNEHCSDCKFACKNERGDLECRVRAPMAMVNQVNHVLTKWPIIRPEDWCGEYKREA